MRRGRTRACLGPRPHPIEEVITLIGSLGQIFLAFCGAAVIVGLAGITYAYLHRRGDPRWLVSRFRRSFVLGTSAIVLLAIGVVVRASGGLSLSRMGAGYAFQSKLTKLVARTHCTLP